MEIITLDNGEKIVIREVLGDWEITTEENYNAPIMNARQVKKLSGKEFENIDEVKEFIKSLYN
jgi:hypothetical protein